MEIKNLAPNIVWSIFDGMTKVPRPSKKEEKIRRWLVDWAAAHNVECRVDRTGNVLMRVPAIPGYEDRPTVVLQAHMDMVCEQNSGVNHDFENDPIETYIDGDWVKARGTTLGADDGIGVALALAVMTDPDGKHGPLEALITYDEETGLTGANNLEAGFMTGKILVNIDSETEGQIFIGCAGGKDTCALFRYALIPAPDRYYAKIRVSGLVGGHSGSDIHLGHANANKVLARFLLGQPDLILASFCGGNLRNAIAREAEAVIGIPARRKDPLVADLNQYIATVEDEVGDIEPNFRMNIETVERPEHVIEPGVADKLLAALQACPHGVQCMSRSMADLVETSTNLASVKMPEPGVIRVETSQRSSVESEKEDIAHTVRTVFELAGAEVTQGQGYPGWKPNLNSPVLAVFRQAYSDMYGKQPEVLAIHAGLETGLFLTKYPGMDMISVGPTMHGVHSPEERLSISSVGRFYDYLKEALSRV
ncbi:MAG: aminoacyl-histidine dipeptidase [Bacteroidales bacterium]|jgi:dipeptidase D|nr:aminoacyl-histidine dipeptidase [Bacteroidales bacterium]